MYLLIWERLVDSMVALEKCVVKSLRLVGGAITSSYYVRIVHTDMENPAQMNMVALMVVDLRLNISKSKAEAVTR